MNVPFWGRIELNKEVVTDFITEHEPITVIRIVIDLLDKTDDIVYIVLGEQEITQNNALAKILRKARNDFPNAVPLRNMRGYVSALGRFLPVKQDDPAKQDTSTAALTAFCSDSTDTGDHVYVTHKVSRLRGDPFPASGSLARCLGRVNTVSGTPPSSFSILIPSLLIKRPMATCGGHPVHRRGPSRSSQVGRCLR
ncbi:MAG: hypothetical protein ACRDRU_12700 [Pseudonocardiaceae bacterium]